MRDRDVIWVNPDKRHIEDQFVIEKDHYEAVILMLSCCIRFIRVEAEGSKMIWIFDRRETADIEAEMATGKPILVEIQNVFQALNTWKDALICLRDYRKR